MKMGFLWSNMKKLNKLIEGKSTNNICKFEKIYFLQVWETFYFSDYISICFFENHLISHKTNNKATAINTVSTTVSLLNQKIRSATELPNGNKNSEEDGTSMIKELIYSRVVT